jgi:hypothetical protein
MWLYLLVPLFLWCIFSFITLIAGLILFWLYYNYSKKKFLFGTLNKKYIPKAIEIPVVTNDPEIMELLYAHLPKLQQNLKDVGCSGLVDEIFVKTQYGPTVPLRYLTHYNDINRYDVLEFVIKKPVVLEQFNKLKLSDLKSKSKDFMSELLQYGFVILENDSKNWASIFASQQKAMLDIFNRGNPAALAEKANWKYSSRRPIITIDAKKILVPTNPTTLDELAMESAMNMYDHLETVSKNVLEIIAEHLCKPTDFFTQNPNVSHSLISSHYEATDRKKSQITHSDLALLGVFTKGTKNSLMALNQSSLDWERVEDRMTNDDILIYPGYYMSYMTDSAIRPLLMSFENNAMDDRINSTFLYTPDTSTKFINDNGQQHVERISRNVTTNRNKFYLDFTLNHFFEGLKSVSGNFGGSGKEKLDE